MLLYKRLKYLCLKKCKHSEALIQDIISKKTGFTPYEIVLYKIELNHYIFEYRAVCYDLLEDELKIISENDI